MGNEPAIVVMQTTILAAEQAGAFDHAHELLLQDQLVAFPTDTVYGLGALAFSPAAIDKLYQVKGRDSAKAIAVLLGDISALEQVASSMGKLAENLARAFWPGPLTLVVKSHPGLPANLSPLPTIGVRMPDHPVARALLNQAGPMAVTSANLSGSANTTTAGQVYEQLHRRIPLILDGGQTPGGQPSTVVDCTGKQLRILRQGPITLDQLESALE
jgi:L-threonylcarbamoyladenylate synthase